MNLIWTIVLISLFLYHSGFITTSLDSTRKGVMMKKGAMMCG